MTTTQFLALDLAAAVLFAGSWAGAAAIVGASTLVPRRRAIAALGLVALGVASLLTDAVLVLVLAGMGWWFAAEKVVLALPLCALGTIAALAFAAPPLLRVARDKTVEIRPAVPASLVAAALAGCAALAARYVVGYPLELVAALALIVVTALGSWLGWAVFSHAGRRLVAGVATLAVLALVASTGFSWLYSIATPGALASAHEHGGRPPSAASISVSDLRTPVDVQATTRQFTLTANEQTVTLTSGATSQAWTFGAVPGPELRVSQGELVEVTLVNQDVAAGVTLHWHGYDVPNGEDGVAGVTQNAVLPGEQFVYRFVAEDAGTYWYHTHQSSADGVKRGLFGALVVEPDGGTTEDLDLVVPVHTLGGSVLLGNSDQATAVDVAAGDTVRLRLINTDQLPHRFRIAGAPFEVVAVDGQDLNRPTSVDGLALRLPAGGRADVVLTVPAGGVAVRTDASKRATLSLVTDAAAQPPEVDEQAPDLDILGYGSPAPTGLPTGHGFVDAEMILDRLPRFLHGVPLQGYTVNGKVFPHIENIEVREGDLVRLTVANRGWETHPMHIHGHHVLVLSRNGVEATGSPLWLDTFDVQPGEVWVVAMIADNPGIWMDHCHNLDHAAEGMMMALRYEGVTSPFEEGGPHGNKSE